MRSKGIIVFALILIVSLSFIVISYSPANSSGTKGDHIAVLSIEGTISENDGYTYDQQWLLSSVEEIQNDNNNKGLLLYIDSPGGTVYEADELYLKLMEYKEVTGRPIYVSMGSMAASGGYYLSCAADEVYANRNTLTGSIGVIMSSSIDMSELLDRLGIKVTTVYSGANKNMFSLDEPVTEQQRAIMQSISDEYYDQFTGIIAQSRSMDKQQVRALADGRLYTANQALQNGLIDGVESFDQTLSRMASDLDVDVYNTYYYSYEYEFSVWDILDMGLLSATNANRELFAIEKMFKSIGNGPLYLVAE